MFSVSEERFSIAHFLFFLNVWSGAFVADFNFNTGFLTAGGNAVELWLSVSESVPVLSVAIVGAGDVALAVAAVEGNRYQADQRINHSHLIIVF